MPIDPSIALNANAPQQPNRIAQFSQFANALGQSRQIAQQNALGQAYADNTDGSGNTDYGAARAELAQSPMGAIALSSGTAGNTIPQQQGQANIAGTNISNNQQQLALQEHRVAALTGMLSNLANKPGASSQDVVNGAQAAVGMGLVDLPTAQTAVNTILSHPQGVSGGVGQLLNSVQAPATQQQNAYGTPTSINNGPNVVSGVQASGPRGGGFTPNTVTPLGVSPETAAGQQTGIDPTTGKPYVTTTGTRLGQEGQGGLVNPGATTPVAPHGADKYPFGPWHQGGAYAPSSNSEPAPSASNGGTPPAPVGPMPGAVTTGMAPGQADAMATSQTASAQDAVNLVRSASESPQRKSILNNMLSDLTTFTSGPGAQHYRDLAATANNVLGTSIDTDGIASAQSFNKFSNQIAEQQSAALGMSSDAKLAAAMHANPNSSLQTSTNQQMLHTLLGNEDAINAKANAWQQSGQPPGSYQQWSQHFNNNFDPRAFQMLRMSPEERQNLQQQMQKAGTLDDFRAKVNSMAQSGILPVPGQQASPAPAP